MTRTFKLERLDGTPADPPSFKTSVLSWTPDDRIPLGSRTLQVVRIRRDDPNELRVLIVEELASGPDRRTRSEPGTSTSTPNASSSPQRSTTRSNTSATLCELIEIQLDLDEGD